MRPLTGISWGVCEYTGDVIVTYHVRHLVYRPRRRGTTHILDHRELQEVLTLRISPLRKTDSTDDGRDRVHGQLRNDDGRREVRGSLSVPSESDARGTAAHALFSLAVHRSHAW